MTYLNKTILATLTAFSLASALPAQAATSQEDVQTFRMAMTEKGDVNMDNYRLRFKYVKGNNQGRTVYLKVIPNSKQGSAFYVGCELNKNQVVALNSSNLVRFAKR